MTVSSTTVKNSYSANGSTTSFAYAFYIAAATELKVYIRSSTGTETLKTYNTHYTLTNIGVAGGGNVVFKTSPSDYTPASGETVVVQRVVPLTQATDYVENDPFPAATHEAALDKLTYVAQQLQEEVDRSLKLSVTNTMTSTEFTTSATDRASKILAFDSSGELSVTTELGTWKGNWAASTAYNLRDMVKQNSASDSSTYKSVYICTTAHTSTGSYLTQNDTSNWSVLVDLAAHDTISELTDTDLSSLASGNLLIYDGSNSWDNKALSGDATLANTGALTIAANAVEGSMLNNNVVSGQTALTSGLASTDELIVSDAGTLKRMDVSVITGYNASLSETLTNKTLTSPVLNTGVSGTAVKDEDNMSSDSATHLATQQSIKAYVDSQIATEDTIAELNDTTISSPSGGHILVYDGSDSWDNVAMSGDATIASSGAITIAAQAVENSMLADDAVGADELAANAVVNASVASGAAIAFSKMESLTASRALVSDGSGDLAVSAVTSTELGYIDGVTSAVQTQLDAKASQGFAIAMSICL